MFALRTGALIGITGASCIIMGKKKYNSNALFYTAARQVILTSSPQRALCVCTGFNEHIIIIILRLLGQIRVIYTWAHLVHILDHIQIQMYSINNNDKVRTYYK